MAEPHNVLITCGGKWVGMVLQLKEAMRDLPALQKGRLLVADRAALTPAGCFADGALVVPPLDSPDYIPALLRLCGEQSVRVLVPLIDLDLVQLAPQRQRFAAVGTTVVCPDPAVLELCFDKMVFARMAREEGLPCPRWIDPAELAAADYPLFHKRRRGFGSIGAGICRSPREARQALERDPTLIFQEYIQAPEASVDALVSVSGECVLCVQRLRDKVVGGEAVQSHTIKSPAVADLALRTIAALARRGLSGPVNLQVFTGAAPKLIEVNPRLGSASVLSNVAAGGRLLRSLLLEACGGQADGRPDDYQEGLALYRYLGDVFHTDHQLQQCFPQAPCRDDSRCLV